MTTSRTRRWGDVAFEELVAHSAFGPRFSGSAYADDGNIATLRTTDLDDDGRISYETMPLAQLDEDRFGNHLLAAGDLVITRSGTCGIAAVFEGFSLPVLPGAFLIRFRMNERAEPRFYRYYFNSPAGRSNILSVARGAVQQNLNITNVETLRVPLAPISEQRRIVSILSAYDDLIENNRRRMALLEEAARQLYREWFVRLRFPGHEHTRITNGVPEGWREVRFGEVLAELESGGRPRGGAKDDDGIPSIGAENVLGIGQYDFSKEKYVPEEYFEKMTRGVVKNRDVILYKDGANVGRSSYFGEGFPHEKCAVNEHVFILRTQPFLGQSLLYFWMTREENRQAIANLNANTAQPGISQEKLKGLPFLLPTERLTRAFNDAVEAQVRQIFALASMNSKLSNARDLLLPRLMSGEIAI